MSPKMTAKWHPKQPPDDSQITPEWLPNDTKMTSKWHPADTQITLLRDIIVSEL